MTGNQPNNVALTRDAENENQIGSSMAVSSSSSAPSMSSEYHAPIQHHDYAAPFAYLITLETTNRERLLGTIEGDTPDSAHITPTPLGQTVIDEFKAIERKMRELTGCYVQVLQYQLMPEHFHGILQIHDTLPKGWTLGKIIGAWKGACSRAYWASSSSSASSSSFPAPSMSLEACPSLFTPGYNDRPLLYKGQLDGWIAYLRDNPRRRWLKQRFPDRLRKVYDFIAGTSKTHYTAVGDTFMITRHLSHTLSR